MSLVQIGPSVSLVKVSPYIAGHLLVNPNNRPNKMYNEATPISG